MAAADNADNLRVSFIVGGLGKGGAEKQFLYMLRALREMGASVQVITLTSGEYHEDSLAQFAALPVYAGASLPARLLKINQAVRAFRPHFIQASHFFASFYAGLAGRFARVPSIGAIRSDLYLDLQGVGRMGRWVLRAPSVFLANSHKARENAPKLRLSPDRVHVLHNVIDLEAFDRQRGGPLAELLSPDRVRAVTVARLTPIKRLERFLQALALARQQVPALEGLIIGGGPEEAALRQQAEALGLRPGQPNAGVRFLGDRSDVPQLLAQSHLYVMTSDREGFPNVLLEAMAASLPVIATPAGETPDLVSDGENGYLVPFDDPYALVERLVRLAQSPAQRRTLGNAGRRIIERRFGYAHLGSSLNDIYQAVARQTNSRPALALFEHFSTPRPRPILRTGKPE